MFNENNIVKKEDSADIIVNTIENDFFQSSKSSECESNVILHKLKSKHQSNGIK
jgi:hypothetical protein